MYPIYIAADEIIRFLYNGLLTWEKKHEYKLKKHKQIDEP